jgi:beta-galactosidase
MKNTFGRLEIAVAGDCRGHLIGTVSANNGQEAAANAMTKVTGSGPLGMWHQSVQTDGDGFFQVELPLGAAGPIRVTARKGEQTARLTANTGDLAAYLTPRPRGAPGYISLVGPWEFLTDPTARAFSQDSSAGWKKIVVPAHWEMEGFVSKNGTALYRKRFRIPRAWQNKRIKFRAEGIYSKAEVWLNNIRLGSHDGGATPFEFDLTAAARPGAENVMTIVVTDSSEAANLDGMSYYAHLNLAGIWRPLGVFCVEPLHIARLAINTDFGADYGNADLCADLTIVNEQGPAVSNAAVELTLVDPNGVSIPLQGFQSQVSLGPWECKHIALRASVPSPQCWNAEQPHLYKIIARVTAPGQKPAVIEQRIGFRKVEIKGRTYTINGKPVKFWGANHHDAHPLCGRAVPAELAQQDVELMKGANLNAIRACSYPPHPALLDATDELGMYVEDEGPFCFINVFYGPEAGRSRDLSDDLRLLPLYISLTSQLLERDRNHPSVVIWSICNESVFGRNLRLTNQFVKTADPTRPTSAGQSANLDIATYHNPTSTWRLKDTTDLPMPVLFDEGFAIFQGMGPQGKGLELDPGLRDFWVTAHFEPIQGILKSEHQFGSMIWAWSDDAFLVPGRGIEYGRRNLPRLHFTDDVYAMAGRGLVGDPPWGVIDGWRRIRPEWWLCKKLFSPIHISEESLKPASPIVVKVENRNAFTNLKRYLCKWRLGDRTGRLRADIAPLSAGTITIAAPSKPTRDDILVLEFFDAGNRLIDGYKLRFGPYKFPSLPNSGQPALLSEEPTSLDFGSFIRLVGKNTELAFDRTSGDLIRGIAGCESVLAAGPSLHVMKSNPQDDGCPTDWHFSSADTRIDGKKKQAVLQWQGSYGSDFAGGFEIRMDDAGDVEITYHFTYNGPQIHVREIGLTMEVPRICDRLEWERKAEWSYYPEDHIGRPHGIATAHPKVAQATPTGKRPFGLDDHVWGCNDFRSAKRNIHWAALTGPSGQGIRVISDGTQTLRACAGTHAISVHILDYYGPSATGTGEWDSAYGIGRTLESGDVLQGNMRLQLLGPKADSRTRRKGT